MGQCLDQFQYSGTARHIGNLLCHKAAHLEVQRLCLWLSFGAATTCIRQGRWWERASFLETILDYVLHKPSIKSEVGAPPLPFSHSQFSWLPGLHTGALYACHPWQATRSQSQVSISAKNGLLCRQKQMYGCTVGVGWGWRTTPTNREHHLEPLGISPKQGPLIVDV